MCKLHLFTKIKRKLVLETKKKSEIELDQSEEMVTIHFFFKLFY